MFVFPNSSIQHSGMKSAAIRLISSATLVVGLAILITGASAAQVTTGQVPPGQHPTAQVPGSPAKTFFSSLIGDWIGTCDQSTDGQKAENKYFHAVVRQLDANTFDTQFDYYRFDTNNGTPIPIGKSSVRTSIGPNGSVTNKITGKGSVYVDKKLKNQDHELTENLTNAGPANFQGTGSGKLNVYGMPFGVGKNGKINNVKSAWSLQNGVLTIDQTLQAAFKAFFVSKKFQFQARYTARHGSDVASLMPGGKTQVSYKP